MRFIMRIVVIIFVSTFCLSAVHAVPCSNLPPGLRRLQRGVDITKLDMMPMDSSITDDGFRRVLFEYTCDENKTWTNPFDPSRTYSIPDQLDSLLTIPGGMLNAESETYSNFEDSKIYSSATAGLGFVKGFFSASGSTTKFQNLILNTTRQVVEIKTAYSTIQADNLPIFLLEPGRVLRAMIQRLPSNYSNNPGAYHNFIQYFGTHMFDSGKFGGVFKATTDFDSNLRKQMTEEQIKAEAQANFFNILKANGGYSGSTQSISELFRTKSTTSIRYYGGSANLFGNWEAWSSTIPGNPWLYVGKLNPITDLIQGDEEKAESLRKAIQIYLDKAYVEELRNIIYSYTNNGGSGGRVGVGVDRITALLQRSINLSSDPTPSHDLVEALDGEIRYNFFIPEWFTQRTQLCYDWHPDGDGGQCGGGAARTLCALVGQQTPYYRDDTDSRSGGCQMRWALFSVGAPSWFTSGVKLCYRWYADDRDKGQCNAGEGSNQYCAPIGTYTPFYRDDTDRRAGGCRMSWLLEIPADAPIWMFNIKLCYYWYADGDGGQCGDGVGNPLCAGANGWTEYYRDDTDERSGGCQMSWGIYLT